MCGLLGIAYRRGIPASKRSLDADGIRDRGPDNVGHRDYGQVEFFHSRLAVIDRKQSSNQPIESEDGRLAMMCNGEIYNHLAIRQSSPYPYRTGSDCEAVLDVYASRGIEGFKSLDGMYAAAIYDARERVLVLHRDNIGKKPLFWYVDENEVVFSSNVHAISSNLERTPALDPKQIEHYFRNGFVHPRHSIYRDIKPVLPGEVIRIDLRTGAIDRSFVEMPDTFDGFDYSDSRAVQSQIAFLIEAATEKRLRGLASPVIMFSGGVDSMVVATACNGFEDRVLMTLRQPLRWLHDEPFARREARRLGQALVYAEPWRKFDRKIERALKQLDQPLSLPSYFLTSLLTMDAKQFGNVIITGDGGDEIFFGYRSFDAWTRDPDAPQPATEPIACGAPFRFPLSDYGIQQSSVDLVGHGFVKVDKATAENQMEARCPLVDRQLVAFVRSIPVQHWRRTSNIPKAPLVQYLLDKGIPQETVFRKKIGTAWPFRYWLAASYPRMIYELERQRERLCDLGVKLSPKRTAFHVFHNFDLFWKEYVLARYLERVSCR